ncbi:MAG: PAS domain S-box protein [Sedimentisphaerales bacterium]|nr:PAS domain S-box protein [Sedimentisphaerales bacterium]
MKIGYKLLLGLVGLTLLIVAVGYTSLFTSQTMLEKAIGESSVAFARQVLNSIDRKIQYRIEDIQALSTDDILCMIAAQSNARFENLPDPNAYIEQVESEWTGEASELMPVMVQLNTNKASMRLQTLQKFYQEKYGYPIFSEIFITNRFGANIAQTNKTSDYYQADETWWQAACQDGMFTGDFEYDESSNAASVVIAVRIEDENGGFLGVIKGILNIQDTINVIEEAKTSADYKTMRLTLITKDGKVIYSTDSDNSSHNMRGQIALLFGNINQKKHAFYAIRPDDNNKRVLFAHAHSKGHCDFKGLNWILLIENNATEIFAPLTQLKNTMLLIGVVVMGLALLSGSVTYRSIAIPLAELKRATIQIAAGNLDTNLASRTKDEIGQLACYFQKMACQLKKTIDELNEEIAERKKSEKKLADNRQFLNNIFDSIQDGIGIMDKEFNIIKVNSWMENAHREQIPLVGKKCYQAYHNRNKACEGCPSVNTLKTGKPDTIIIPNPCKNIKSEWIELSTFPLKDQNGNITGVIEYVKDVTEHRKAEQSLQRSEQRFREVAENAREWVWETDASGVYTYASPVVREMLGFSPDELVGKKHFYDLFHPDDRETFKAAAFDVFAKKLTFQRFVNRNLHKNGHTVWLSTSGVPILDDQGNLLGYRGVDADITEQRKAEAILSERAEQIMQHHNTLLKLANMPEEDFDSLLRTTLEQSAEVLNVERVSVWLFNTDRTEIICRDLFTRTSKIHESGDSLKVEEYPIYFKALENSRIIATNNTQIDARTREYKDTYLLPKGITSMIDVPIRLHGRIIGIICNEHTGPAREWTNTEQDFAASIADMISLTLEAAERRKAEKKLEKANKDLKATNEELSRINRQIQDFVHIAAHDLKTPVRGIGTLADWIISDYGDKLDDQGRQNIRLLKARVVKIAKLIDGMLQFSKIARNRHNDKKINLNREISEIITKIKPATSIEFAVDSLPVVTGERDHIIQVFENLLANAVMFMNKPKGLIKVGCVEQGDFWKFNVDDNGPGIEQKHFERIFKIFQILPKNDEAETSGIGLPIAKKIIELYGGQIWVNSEVGKGTTFSFTFPKDGKQEYLAENVSVTVQTEENPDDAGDQNNES